VCCIPKHYTDNMDCTRIRNGKNMILIKKKIYDDVNDGYKKKKWNTKIYTASQIQITVGEPQDQLFYLFSNVRPWKQKSTKDCCLVVVDKKK